MNPVYADALLFKEAVEATAIQLALFRPVYIVGIEARGFIYGDGFIPNRIAVITQRGFKPGCKCGGTLLDIVNPISSSRPCVVLDPFMGSGTVALVALRARRDFIGIELNGDYAQMARHRISSELAQSRLL